MAVELHSPSIVSMNSLTGNLRNGFPVAEKAHKTIKQLLFAKKVSEPSPGSPTKFQKALAELLGTYILMFLGCAGALVDRIVPLTHFGMCLIWALVVIALVYTLGHVSGAHLNPAVTIAFCADSRLSLMQVPIYIMSQLVGSILACLTLKALFHDQHDIRPTLTQYKSSTSDLEAIAWEFIMTFILMFIVYGAAIDDRAHKTQSGIAVGVTVLINSVIAGPITGASMNPVRSIGPAIVSGVYKNLWVYVVAPIVGALAATLVYSLLRIPESKIEENVKIIDNDTYVFPEVSISTRF